MIPSPEPREMVFNVGPETAQGRKVMMTVRSKNEGDLKGPYFFFYNPQRVPLLAWIRVMVFGKLSGQLLNPGEIMQEGLPGLSQLTRQGGGNR